MAGLPTVGSLSAAYRSTRRGTRPADQEGGYCGETSVIYAARVDEQRIVEVHGHARAFRVLGTVPTVLLLLHGIGSNGATWDTVAPALAERFTVIVPDLLGHGRSAKPRADYSIGGYANGMRDLLGLLDVERVTVVGHSFGGGVAMQFAYQFPERTDRLVVVAGGGLGPQVSVALRALTLPGASMALGLSQLAPSWLAGAALRVG